MTLAEELRNAQVRMNSIVQTYKTSYGASEFSSILIEHILTHINDGYCDYPVHSSDFPMFTQSDADWLLNHGFTFDIGYSDIIRIYWVSPADTDGG